MARRNGCALIDRVSERNLLSVQPPFIQAGASEMDAQDRIKTNH